VLDCYRLARYYHIDPRIFINMPLSEVTSHLKWTVMLAQKMQDEARDDG
jgi:hypothetical protein